MTVQRATRVYYLLTLTRWFPVGLIVGIVILVHTGRGLTIAEAATASAVTGLVCFALELPTSGFADAFGRRPVYLVAALMNVVASFAFYVAHSFIAFVIAGVLIGAFRALDSGPLEAWFVDAVHEERPGADVDQELSRSGTLLGLGMAVGALVSGLLIWWHPLADQPALDLPVAVFVGLNVVHLMAVALLLREPHRPHRTGAAMASVRETPKVIVDGLSLVLHSRVLLGIILAEVSWSIGMIAFEALLPLRLEEMLGSAQLAGAAMGPVAAAGWGVFALGTWLAGKASTRWGVARAAILGRSLNALGVLLMGVALTPIGLLAAYFFTYTMHGLTGPPHSALLHREASAQNRSTVLSMNSMMSFLSFGIAAPLAGLLAARTSIAAAILAVGVVSALGAIGYLPARRAERRRGDALTDSPDPGAGPGTDVQPS